MAFECDTLDNNEMVASVKFTVYTTTGKYPVVLCSVYAPNLLSGTSDQPNGILKTHLYQHHPRAADSVDQYGSGT